MKEATLIFPHQLFRKNPAVSKDRKIFLIEDPLFFGDVRYPLKFHKKKILFHRASMKAYFNYLKYSGFNVEYVEYKMLKNFETTNYLPEFFRNQKLQLIHFTDVTDFILEKRIGRLSEKSEIELKKYSTHMFLTEEKFLRKYFSKKKSYFMASFYKEQRKRLNILIDDGNPVGGKWSFDDENRKKLPAGIKIPSVKFPAENEYVINARKYVERYFSDNPGYTEDFIYPVTFELADFWLDDFLKNRLNLFGDYEDAIAKDQGFLFHSVLTPMLNSGLLTPHYVLIKVLKFSEKNKMPLNSLEGFIRQIIGWREYIRAIYLLEGVRERTTNYFEFKKKMPKAFYDGTTGIEPIDDTIKKLLNTAYSHHIERLMILGNFMLLCEINPDEVYKWFMEMYIDAYDWVMVPNVYGMSQYADGGLMSTKPYISSSNYILKMSDYQKGDWCKIWDALYWRFIYKHKVAFENNPRMKVMIMQLDRMGKEKLNNHLKIAESFLRKLI